MKRQKDSLLLQLPAALLGIVACGLVQAQTSTAGDNGAQATARPGLRVFSIHDIDHDGRLSREEYRQFVTRIENRRKASGRPPQQFLPLLAFDTVDSNHDDYISEDEMIAVLNRALQKRRRYRFRGNW